MYNIETGRMVIREFTPEDAGDLHPYGILRRDRITGEV